MRKHEQQTRRLENMSKFFRASNFLKLKHYKVLCMMLLSVLCMSELFGNLIENGDFEQGETLWRVRNNNGQIDEEIFAQGKRSLKIESHSDDPSRVYYANAIEVKPNTNYKLSVWIKSEGAENAEIRLISLDKDKK